MRFVVFGSLNIDHTYHVPHLLRMGETMASCSYDRNVGGKGFNQAVALSRAGSDVCFAGAVGKDGAFLTDYLKGCGVDTSCIRVLDEPTGHAIIQVDAAGGNAILLFGGANQCISDEMIEETIRFCAPGDWILLQNEINDGARIIRAAHNRGLKVILNPSPVSRELLDWPLELVSMLILNEVEGADLTGQTQPQAIADSLLARYPHMRVVLTLGEQGAIHADGSQRCEQAAYACDVVDTTAAGDTFTGYFLHAAARGEAIDAALHQAACAAAIAVGRPGAAASIPMREEVARQLAKEE